MTPHHTEFATLVLDLMDFIEEKIGEAIEDEGARAGAVTEAGGAIPVLRDRLGEKEHVRTLFTLALDNPMNDSANWWSGLARKDRAEFEAEAETLLKAWAALRQVVDAHAEEA